MFQHGGYGPKGSRLRLWAHVAVIVILIVVVVAVVVKHGS
jgi:hypothetical protein